MKSYIITALLTFAGASHSADLKCATCITSGFNYCVQGKDGQVLEKGETPTFHCCKDDSCSEASDPDYTCSKTYSDMDYALTFCPQKKEKCGPKQDYSFDDEESSESVTVSNLTLGESCSYKMKSDCGSPAFKVNGTKVNITYIEFEGSQVNKTEKGAGKGKSPKDGMPMRNTNFEDSGDQG